MPSSAFAQATVGARGRVFGKGAAPYSLATVGRPAAGTRFQGVTYIQAGRGRRSPTAARGNASAPRLAARARLSNRLTPRRRPSLRPSERPQPPSRRGRERRPRPGDVAVLKLLNRRNHRLERAPGARSPAALAGRKHRHDLEPLGAHVPRRNDRRGLARFAAFAAQAGFAARALSSVAARISPVR